MTSRKSFINTHLVAEFEAKQFAAHVALVGALVRVHRRDVAHQRDMRLVLVVAERAREIVGFRVRLDVIGQVSAGAECGAWWKQYE